jgi:hypothetical protein
MKKPSTDWNSLAKTLKVNGVGNATSDHSADDTAPYGFATRVVALWTAARDAEAQLARWQRWSLRAAFGTCVILGLVLVSGAGRGDGGSTLFPLPALGL